MFCFPVHLWLGPLFSNQMAASSWRRRVHSAIWSFSPLSPLHLETLSLPTCSEKQNISSSSDELAEMTLAVTDDQSLGYHELRPSEKCMNTSNWRQWPISSGTCVTIMGSSFTVQYNCSNNFSFVLHYILSSPGYWTESQRHCLSLVKLLEKRTTACN